ncbi:multiprotein-bridging factor 1 family protein [Nocardia sp. NPDC058640]|uniref:helix-turn-helix domain-containing protein n=1 Tax=Nocardia sp. NPDC058640 TaxID=3346571 RepID=UPI00365B9BCC
MTDDRDTAFNLADALADQEIQLKEKLVAARKALRFEQAEIAEWMRVDVHTIAEFERLDSNPTLSMIRNYAFMVGCLVKYDVEVTQ